LHATTAIIFWRSLYVDVRKLTGFADRAKWFPNNVFTNKPEKQLASLQAFLRHCRQGKPAFAPQPAPIPAFDLSLDEAVSRSAYRRRFAIHECLQRRLVA
jgi:hypothetical protein